MKAFIGWLTHKWVEWKKKKEFKWECPKCGVDRLKDPCPKGHTAAITGECPMVGTAQTESNQ